MSEIWDGKKPNLGSKRLRDKIKIKRFTSKSMNLINKTLTVFIQCWRFLCAAGFFLFLHRNGKFIGMVSEMMWFLGNNESGKFTDSVSGDYEAMKLYYRCLFWALKHHFNWPNKHFFHFRRILEIFKFFKEILGSLKCLDVFFRTAQPHFVDLKVICVNIGAKTSVLYFLFSFFASIFKEIENEVNHSVFFSVKICIWDAS
jgi:hypothetical protein